MESKKLVLDFSKWRCGGMLQNKHGEGRTALLNDEGFMCCLGQFSLQINEDLRHSDLLNLTSPDEVSKPIRELKKEINGAIYNTDISDIAISINDNEDTSSSDKIKSLIILFNEHGFEIEVINQY